MAIIKCPECKKEISDKAGTCIYCGYPLNKQVITGKAIFRTSGDPLGLVGKYVIKDRDGNLVAKLRANDFFEVSVHTDTEFYIRYSASFGSYKKVIASANRESRFDIGLSAGGFGFYVRQIK